MANKTCVFFGHRDAVREEVEIAVKEESRKLILRGVTDFYFGGMGNFDYIAAAAVRDLKVEFPCITMTLVLPYHTNSFENNREYLQSYYDYIVFPIAPNVHPKVAIPKRNTWLVQQSTHVICYLRRRSGGAYKAVSQAKSKGKIIINI